MIVSLFSFFNDLYLFLILAFLVGLGGILFNFRNFFIIFISIEVLLLILNLSFILTSIFLNDSFGLIFTLLILTVAAAEASIGLALLVLFYRTRSNILIKNKFYLKG